ncbi:MAG: hypothetical protein V2A76_18515 [Planctomycetota bacterium]
MEQAGQQFLAGAGLSDEEHRLHPSRGPAHGADQFLMRRTLADDAAVAVEAGTVLEQFVLLALIDQRGLVEDGSRSDELEGR